YSKRRQLLLFIELIDIHEFAVANPFRFKKYDAGSDAFKAVTGQIATAMNAIADSLLLLSNSTSLNGNKSLDFIRLERLVQEAKAAVTTFETSARIDEHRHEVLQLRNLLDYTQNQFKKIKLVEAILNRSHAKGNLEVNQRDHLKFIT